MGFQLVPVSMTLDDLERS